MAVLAASLLDRVAEILTRYSMLPPGARIGVAVSGGADSVVLLHLLHRLAGRFQIQLAVLHANHQLRAAESDRDEALVRQLAASLALSLFCEAVPLTPGNLEQEARTARRAFFFRLRKQAGLAKIALGHTRSDQAETVLLRLLRGSGTTGLAGMRFITPEGLIRPLLSTSRQEVRDWALAEGIAWREDSTNQDQRFRRNRLRAKTLPELTADYNSNLEPVLAHTATIAQAEEDYWATQVGPLCNTLARQSHWGLLVEAPALVTLHPAVQRRAVRHLLTHLKGDLRSLDLAHVDAILAICGSAHGHDRVLVPGVDALRSFQTLLLTQPGRLTADNRQYSVPLPPGDWISLPAAAGAIRLNPVNSESQFCDIFKSEEDFPSEVAYINPRVLSDAGLIRPLYVRNWEPGDQVHRPGHSRPEKLKSLFGEHRVLLWERRHWPVITCGEEVVWVRRFGCSAQFAASESATSVFRLEYSVNEYPAEL